MAKAIDINIPYKFELRDYQQTFFQEIMEAPLKRAVLVWHRRSGKDKTMLNAMVWQMLKRVGNYYYVFPEFNQGRKALWDNIDSQSFRTIDHIPKEIRTRTDQQQMLIELYNGSVFQVVGASDIDRIVGTNPIGIVFSEYSLMSPSVLGYLLPIVTENKGFMWFNFTPRGNNHAKELYLTAKKRNWFVSFLTANDTGVMSKEELEETKTEYLAMYGDTRLFNQEFMCSFDEPIIGSYYGDAIAQAKEQGRVTKVPHLVELPTYTYWDLGLGDATAIWFVQFKGDEVHLIDYHEENSKGLDHYVKIIQNKPYVYGDHYAPHDIKIREYGSGKSRIETARSLGINFKIAPKLQIEDGINAARVLLSRCWFDEEKCKVGLECLINYRRKYNEETRSYDNRPLHDWSSNGADAFRYLAVAAKKQQAAGYAPMDDVPAYAHAGYITEVQERRNPFETPEQRQLRLEAEQQAPTTDVFNEGGWYR